MPRLFFAIELPEKVRNEALRTAETMRASAGKPGGLPAAVRWLPEEHYHLTLKFLGEFPTDRIPELLMRAWSRLARSEPFTAELAGVGAFPSTRDARVLWLGLGRGQAEFARIARKLDSAAGRFGVKREPRPFRAHLSIARLRDPEEIPLDQLLGPDSMPFSVAEVVLYESRLSPAGASYFPLNRLPLGQPKDPLIEFVPDF